LALFLKGNITPMQTIYAYFRWVLFATLFIFSPCSVQADSDLFEALGEVLQQLNNQPTETQPQSQPKSQPQSKQEWKILDEILSEKPHPLVGLLLSILAGANCEQDDASAQKKFLRFLQTIGKWQSNYNALQASTWTLTPSEDIVAQTFPKISAPTTTLPPTLLAEAVTDAIPIYRGTIAYMAKICGVNHIRVARGLNFLSELYRTKKDYDNAKYALLDAQQIMEQKKYANHPDKAGLYNNLGLFYGLIGEYSEAKNKFKQAVTLAKDILANPADIFGPNYPYTAATLHKDSIKGLQNLADVYVILGEYAKAEETFQEALDALNAVVSEPLNLSEQQKRAQEMGDKYEEIRAKIRGEFEGYEEVALRQNMAHFYALVLGDYDEAERLFKDALEIIDEKRQLPHFVAAAINHGLGYVYQQKQQNAAAVNHYEQALKIYQRLPEWRYSAFSVGALTHLGYLNYLQGKNTLAEQRLQQAVELSKKLSESKVNRAIALGGSLYHLAMFYQWKGELDKAETHIKEALQIYQKILCGNHSPGKIYQKIPCDTRSGTVSDIHPGIVEMMQHFAALKFDQGKIKEAIDLVKEVQPLTKNVLKNILSFGTEHQRLAYQQRSYPYDLLARTANCNNPKAQEANCNDPKTQEEAQEAIPLLANAVLHNKGIVLDSLMEDYQLAANPKIKDQIRSTKVQLMKLLMAIPQNNNEIEKLKRELKKLESGLARKVGARQAFEVDFHKVQEKLPQHSVLVEFIRYKHFVGKRHRDNAIRYKHFVGKRHRDNAYYGAVVIPKTGEPQWVFLGKANVIEPQVVDYQTMMRCKPKNNSSEENNNCPNNYRQVKQRLKKLYQQVWAPIETNENFPKGIKKVILSPDGELNFISFATLFTPDDEFLIKNFDLYYVASGRDLLREPKSVEESTMMVYALNEWKNHSAKTKLENISVPSAITLRDRQAYLNLRLNFLKGTIPEANELKNMGESLQLKVEMFFNSDATEERFHHLQSSPRILHFATHGVFLHPTKEGVVTDFFLTSNSDVMSTPPLAVLSNPMYRSFVALAGAQTTLDAWKKGESSLFPPENDGILTAEEVSNLSLKGNWLTMFSACETGRGEGRAGEGVLGLRRGFVRAGTQNLLMTLWAVKDDIKAIRDFELDFYQQAIETQNAPKALNDMQRKWLYQIWLPEKKKEDNNWEDELEDEKEEEVVAEKGSIPLLDAIRFIGPFVMSFQGVLEKD
jgi:CHAT domain-containing protein